MKCGVHLPNYQWRAFYGSELDAVRDLQPSSLLYLLYEQQPADVRKAQLSQVKKLVAELGCRLYVRVYSTGIPRKDPTDWALTCADLVEEAFSTSVEIIPANEMNLASEGGHKDWGRHRWWLKLFADNYRLHRPHDTLHFPAPYPGFDGAEAIEYWKQLESLADLYDVVDVHEYGPTFGLHEHAATTIQKPVVITEYNQIDPYQMAEKTANQSYVTDAIWFLLRGTDDQAPYFLMKSACYDSFKKSHDITTVTRSLTDMPEFRFGIKAKADQLGRDVVGDPLTDEQYLGAGFCYQFTTKGKFEYDQKANTVHFFPATNPKA